MEFENLMYRRIRKKSNDKCDLIILIDSIKRTYTSRPAREINTVPKPPAVNHLCVERPSNSMNNDTAATQIAVYTAFPVKSMLICHSLGIYRIRFVFTYLRNAPGINKLN